MEIFGSEYVIDHIVAEFKIRAEQYIYRVYVTDTLKCLAESWGGEVLCRWKDMIEPQELEDGDEVALKVIQKLGLKVKHEDGFYETESDSVA